MFIQDSQPVVGWDLRSIEQVPTLADRLYALYVLLLMVMCIAWIAELWRLLGFSSRHTRWRLKQALQQLSEGQVSALAGIAAKLRKATPEAGLRRWAGIAPDSSRPMFLQAITDADEHFKIVAGRIELILSHMRRSLVFSGILLGAFACFEIANLMKGMYQEKARSFAIVASYQGTATQLGAGLLFLAVIYVVYWHFRARLARRHHDWESFCAHVEQLQ